MRNIKLLTGKVRSFIHLRPYLLFVSILSPALENQRSQTPYLEEELFKASALCCTLTLAITVFISVTT